MAEPDPSKRSAFWPFNWMRDEKFWRDITVQMTGTGIVALVVFLYASALGYLTPNGGNSGFRITMFLVGVALAIVAVCMTLITIASARGMQRQEGGRAGLRYAIGLGALFLLQLSLAVIPWLISITSDGSIKPFG